MPKVGSKHFSYSKKGIAEAKKAAQVSGMPMQMKKPMSNEDMVKRMKKMEGRRGKK